MWKKPITEKRAGGVQAPVPQTKGEEYVFFFGK
jgi:hypothetical protein